MNTFNMNIVLFDGVCNLCNGAVNMLIKHDGNNELYFAAQQTVSGEALLKKYGLNDNLKTIIFIRNNSIFYKSDAVIEIAKLTTGWTKVLKFAIYIPENIRNWMYNLVANNRYTIFGKRNMCMIPSNQNQNKFL